MADMPKTTEERILLCVSRARQGNGGEGPGPTSDMGAFRYVGDDHRRRGPRLCPNCAPTEPIPSHLTSASVVANPRRDGVATGRAG